MRLYLVDCSGYLKLQYGRYKGQGVSLKMNYAWVCCYRYINYLWFSVVWWWVFRWYNNESEMFSLPNLWVFDCVCPYIILWTSKYSLPLVIMNKLLTMKLALISDGDCLNLESSLSPCVCVFFFCIIMYGSRGILWVWHMYVSLVCQWFLQNGFEPLSSYIYKMKNIAIYIWASHLIVPMTGSLLPNLELSSSVKVLSSCPLNEITVCESSFHYSHITQNPNVIFYYLRRVCHTYPIILSGIGSVAKQAVNRLDEWEERRLWKKDRRLY